MYFNKFSSGTILALLALSGMLFLVPLAVPVHASQDASLPTISTNINVYINGAGTVGSSLKITNPISNSYAITSITIFAPTNFAFSAFGGLGTYFNLEPVQTAGAITFTSNVGGLAPGFTDTIPLGTITSSVASPVTAAPPTSTFTTSLIDAGSSPASYPGPTWTVYTLATGTAIASVTPLAPANYVAGSAPLTITATLNTNQPGVPITFKVTTAPHTGFTATVSPSSTTTVASSTTAAATTIFTPSNYAGLVPDSTTITATLGTGGSSLQSSAVTTVAGSPSTVGWFYANTTPFAAGTTIYLTGAGYFNTPSNTALGMLGYISPASPYGHLAVTVSDAYGNSIAFVSISGLSITIAASGGAGFDNSALGTNPLISTITGATGVALGTGYVTYPYFQPYTYGSIGSLTAIMAGTYIPSSTPFSVSANSGTIFTGTQAALYSLVVTGSPGAGSTDKLTATASPANTQPGVPVTFNLCGQQVGATQCAGTTPGYGGNFVGGSQIGFVSSTSTSGTATASYVLDPAFGHAAYWNDTAPAPVVGTPKAILPYVQTTPIVTTTAGAPSTFKVLVFFDALQAHPVTGSFVAGQNAYINVELVDAYGNLAVNTLVNQIQVTLSATSPTALSATTTYIAFGFSYSDSTFGNIQWTVPSSIAAGTVLTLTAAGVVNGVAVSPSTTVTIVSPLPSLNVKSPVPTNGYLYSYTTGLTFSGWANISKGYSPATDSISSIGYKVGTNHWVATPGAGTQDNYVLSTFLPVGLSTIMFNATDANKNTVVSSSYTVLVDIAATTFTFGSATSNTGCVTVTAATAQGDFNTATFTASFGGVAVPAASISWSGTQTPGTAGSLTATICGLTSQTATLSVTGSTLAGLSATSTESLTVTVPFANSISFNTGSATYGLNGAFKGVTLSVTNGWNTPQTIVVYATLKSGSSIYVAEGTVTVAAGGSATVFCVDLQTIPAGPYSVTFAAVTTANQAVSAPTTPISLTAT
jgi:hypothetical protein